MAIYKLQEDRIIELVQTTFSNEQIDEARDLQKFLRFVLLFDVRNTLH